MGNMTSSSNPSVEMVKMNGNDNDLLTQKAELEKRIEESKDALNTFGKNLRPHVKDVVEKELTDLEKELKKINEQLSANGGGGKRKSKRTKSNRSKKSKKSKKSNKSKRTRK